MSSTLQTEFAKLFEGMSFEELEECAKSFAFANCETREGLNEVLRAHAKLVQ